MIDSSLRQFELQLSIITVTFNNAAGLNRTLRSVAEQSYDCDRPQFEVVVVDGGSKDATSDVIRAFTRLLPLRYISEADRGVYDAMNKGLGLSRGAFVLYLNGGDEFHGPQSLRSVMEALLDNPVWAVGRAQRPDSSGRFVDIPSYPFRRMHHLLGVQPHCHQAIVVSRLAMDVLGGFSESFEFAADFHLVVRLAMISSPKEFSQYVCKYEGGGVSQLRWRHIPALQRRVRSEVFNYPRSIAILDYLFSYYRFVRLLVANRPRSIGRFSRRRRHGLE